MDVVAAGRIETLSVPAWAQLPWLVHGFSTRAGGTTTVYQPFLVRDLASGSSLERGGDLNLGFTSLDSREAVTGNRELLLAQLLGSGHIAGEQATGSNAGLVTVRQTHSATVHRVDRSHALRPEMAPVLAGDGLMTDTPGVLLGILTADCVPVLVVDPVRRAAAAFHAGWRGTVQGIVEHGVSRMREDFGSVPEELLAAIGPAIGACCYTVGGEVREQFAARFAYAGELFTDFDRDPAATSAVPGETATTLRLNLAEANRQQLLSVGVSATNIRLIDACTSCETRRFFSHRAEQGATGRMMAIVGIRGF